MLAIDVGNTQITVGLFEGGELKDLFRVSTESCLESSSFMEYLPEDHKLVSTDVVISSVRTAVTEIIAREVEALTGRKPFVVNVATPLGIEIRYKTRETLGIDRLIGAAAALKLYRKHEEAIIVVDMGTATTIDYISDKGIFLGGMIAPGLKSSYNGLLAAAPQLPRLEDLSVHSIIGSTTADCIRSGVVAGHAAMIRGSVEMISSAQGTRPVIVLTGGLSNLVKEFLPPDYIQDEFLILKGLSYLSDLHPD